jgi:hypothetical protein
MPPRRVLIIAALLFASVLLIRLPARWLTGLLPAAAACRSPTGTIWHGQCTEITIAAHTWHNVNWILRPARLLGARLVADVELDDAKANGKGTVALGLNGAIDIESLLLRLPLRNEILPGVNGWDGTVEVSAQTASLRQAALASWQGELQLRDLTRNSDGVVFGSFRWQPVLEGAGKRLAGPVSSLPGDASGPLRLSGSLGVGLNGEYSLDAKVAPGATAGDAITTALNAFGAGDADGNRPIFIGGKF